MIEKEQQLIEEFEKTKKEVADFEKLCEEFQIKAMELKAMKKRIDEERKWILAKIEQQKIKEDQFAELKQMMKGMKQYGKCDEFFKRGKRDSN